MYFYRKFKLDLHELYYPFYENIYLNIYDNEIYSSSVEIFVTIICFLEENDENWNLYI